MTRYSTGYQGPMLPAAGPRGSIGGGGGGGGGAMGGIKTAHQGLNQISDAVNQINNATGSGGGGGSRPSVGGVTADDFGDGNPGFDYSGGDLSTGDAQSTFKNTSASLLKSLGLKKGGKVPSASKRGDGIAQRGKTRGKMC